MSIFDRDRIGCNIPCRIIDTSNPDAKEEYGKINWCQAFEGHTVGLVDLFARERQVKGSWLVMEVDVHPSPEWILKALFSD